MKPFTYQNWHAWESNGRVLLSDESAKKLQDFTDADACINWLYMNGAKEAARALNAHVKSGSPALALANALRAWVNDSGLTGDDYHAALHHPATTANDRGALIRVMHRNERPGDADRVRELATEIQNWKEPKSAPVVVTLKRMQREVPAPRNGRPGYRWAPGYIVNGEYPPVSRNEAYSRAREIGGPKVKVQIED